MEKISDQKKISNCKNRYLFLFLTFMTILPFSSQEKLKEKLEKKIKEQTEEISTLTNLLKTKILENDNFPSNQNMTFSYTKISKYIIKNAKNREQDYFYCTLREIIGNPLSGLTDSFLRNLMFAHKKKFKNGKLKKIEICKFDEEFENELELVLGEKIDFEKDVISGEKVYKFVSLLLHYLQEIKGIPISHSYVLHTMSNIFELDIDQKFKKKLRIQNMFPKSQISSVLFDLNMRQLLRGFLAECVIKKQIKKKFNFWFDELMLESELDLQSRKLTGRTVENSRRKYERIFGLKNFDFEELAIREQKTRKNLSHIFWHVNHPENVLKNNLCFECHEWVKMISKDLGRIYSITGSVRFDSSYDQVIDKKLENLRKKHIEVGANRATPDATERTMVLKQMAQRGNVRAINELAQNQYFGNFDQGVPVDRERAFQNYQRAAELGDIHAEANVGILKFQSKKIFEKFFNFF